MSYCEANIFFIIEISFSIIIMYCFYRYKLRKYILVLSSITLLWGAYMAYDTYQQNRIFERQIYSYVQDGVISESIHVEDIKGDSEKHRITKQVNKFVRLEEVILKHD